uniref:restriction endonuclease subunit S n=1 Tax=Candidatus Fimenecus sp. TaxID=3022888 RepID=UPI00402A0C5D
MNLNISEWKEYRLGDLFEIKKGKRLTSEDQTEGTTPYIGAIDSNNGVSNYIGQAPIHEGNTISLSYNGSVGQAFYQPIPFWATDDVNVLYFRDKTISFNRNMALFICTILKQEQYRYCYGRKWVLDSMNETMVKLPTKGDKPDWSYMEKYISSLKSQAVTSTKKVGDISFDYKKWESFSFGRLITEENIYKAKAYSKTELVTSDVWKEGFIHFVSRTEENNSIDCYAMKSDFSDIEEGNAITVGDTTSTIAYQSEPFVNGDHIIVIRADWLNKYTGMFIVSLLRKERYRYSYGRAYLMDSIKNTKLHLPVKKRDGKPIIDDSHTFSDEGYLPDWEWMETYIKSLPYSDRI